MKKLLALSLMCWLCWLSPKDSEAQSSNTVPPTCTVAQLSAGTCAPALEGTLVHITDGNAAVDTDCATTTGAIDLICEYDGAAHADRSNNETASVRAKDLDLAFISRVSVIGFVNFLLRCLTKFP